MASSRWRFAPRGRSCARVADLGGLNVWGAPKDFPEIQQVILIEFPNIFRKQDDPHKGLTRVIHHPVIPT